MSQYIATRLREMVREHFRGYCAYCQTDESLTVTTFEIEHIVPRSADGPTEFENLCLACPMCNRYKADRQLGDLETGEKVPLFHPHRDLWSDHFDWTVSGTVIVGLTETGRATAHTLRMNRLQVVSVRELWVDAGRHPPS